VAGDPRLAARARISRRTFVELLLAIACQSIAGCAGTESRVPPYTGTAPKAQTLYVIAGGWHTEIAIPVRTLSGPLTDLKEVKSSTANVAFGWGQRDYYMAATPDFGDLLKAAVSGPAVMLVIPLDGPPADTFGPSNVFAVPVSSEGLARLAEYLWADLQKDPTGVPRPIAAGPYVGSAFYASTSTYEVLHNCNTWTAEALHLAGIAVSADGVIFAGQVLDQVRKLPAGDEPGYHSSATRRMTLTQVNAARGGPTQVG